MLIRKVWFRVLMVLLFVLSIDSAVYLFSLPFKRDDSVFALGGIFILLSICSAFSLATITSFVKGRHEIFEGRVDGLKDQLVDLLEKLNDRKEDCFEKLKEQFIYPLIALDYEQWKDRRATDEIYNRMGDLLEEIGNVDTRIVRVELTLFEQKYNQLFISVIRLAGNVLHIENFTGTLKLIVFSGLIYGFIFLLPETAVGDFLVLNLVVLSISYSLLELYFQYTWVRQESLEEAER